MSNEDTRVVEKCKNSWILLLENFRKLGCRQSCAEDSNKKFYLFWEDELVIMINILREFCDAFILFTCDYPPHKKVPKYFYSLSF